MARLSGFAGFDEAYRSCSVAILFAAIMVYQGSPLGATVRSAAAGLAGRCLVPATVGTGIRLGSGQQPWARR